MSLLETTLMEHKDISIEGSHQLLQKNSFKELYLRLGDNNPRLRERAEDLLMLVATLKNFSSPNQMINMLIKEPLESTKPKLVIGRMSLIVKFLQKHPMRNAQG
jgi:hypothetical protein